MRIFSAIARGLALLVERHHYHRRAVFEHPARILAELVFAFLQRNRVDDALALKALQPGLDDLPLRGVDHERHPGYLRLAGQQLQVARHRGDAVDHALVHADVDDVGAVLHLLPGDAYRFFELAFFDELRELRRTGDVGPLADHDVDARLLGEWLRSGKPERLGFQSSSAHAATTSRSGQARAERRRRAPSRWRRCAPACCRSSRRRC